MLTLNPWIVFKSYLLLVKLVILKSKYIEHKALQKVTCTYTHSKVWYKANNRLGNKYLERAGHWCCIIIQIFYYFIMCLSLDSQPPFLSLFMINGLCLFFCFWSVTWGIRNIQWNLWLIFILAMTQMKITLGCLGTWGMKFRKRNSCKLFELRLWENKQHGCLG